MYISREQLDHIAEIIEDCTADTPLSTVIAIASLLVAFGAVAVSLYIANRQNQIALYERRLECYQKFIALNTFMGFTSKYETCETQKQTEGDPAFQCQQKYLDIHGLLVDKEFQKYRFNCICRNIYVLNCIEKDGSFFSSAQFLVGLSDEKSLIVANNALTEFVSELFKHPNEMSLDKIKQTRDKFVDTFRNIVPIGDELKKELMIGNRKGGLKQWDTRLKNCFQNFVRPE